jgi:uncharacterized protein involved in exopolysaccharide biosynthesis
MSDRELQLHRTQMKLTDTLEAVTTKLAASEAALEKSQAEVRRMTIVARAGWESARTLAIAGLHRATERAADEALAALDAGLL